MIMQKKTQCTSFDIYINGNKIDHVDSILYLGVQIDNKLKWEGHIMSLYTKLCSFSDMISKIRSLVDVKCLITLYYVYVYSKLQYAILSLEKCHK